MKSMGGYLFRILICSGFATVLLFPHPTSAVTCQKPIAKLVSVQGSVEAQRAGETQWQQTKLNDTFCPGDKLRTDRKSRAELSLAKSILRLNANTTFTLKDIREGDTALIDLLKGAVYFFSLAPKSLEVVTPFAVAAVRGTEFLIAVEDDKTSLTVFEGEVLASNPTGSLALSRGQSAIAKPGQAPVQQIVVRPRDTIHWTLYYLPVIDIRPEDFEGGIRRSILSYRKGDLKTAFDEAENAPVAEKPRFFTYLASLELSVGQVDAAEQNIQQALGLDPKNSEAFALQSIIFLAQNEKDKAFSKAQQAVKADPHSANAQIALSYSQQAQFDLEGALTSAQVAVKLGPRNALAWARLAELWSAHGYRDNALEAAQKAVSLNPNLARTQTVLGYAHLTRQDTDEARSAFQKAIEFDQADPLPKLGQGLAKIRDRELSEGREDIEEAVNLDPNNSLMRSYLGKAYYEEKRSNKASEQFKIAKKRDPRDPTPYLYDAIEKQTTNRPVEALHDLQTSIELNGNRASFRSQLLLDSDLASRSAAIGRIYSDLGFQNRALLEGWLSATTDPTNFSAHRLLADSYSILPRHEIARVSELLQSQLLQPINMTPIQPRLAESNLLLISAGGPGALSFNEFNPLFKRNGVTFQGNSIVGENDTYSGEGIVSGIFDRASFSVGYSKFDTNGFRANADQEDDLFNAFAQYQITPQTSIQAEYKYRDTVKGDLLQRFFKDNVFSTRRIRDKTSSARFGLHHSLMPGLEVIGNFSYQEMDRKDTNPIVNINGEDESFGSELQFLFRSKYINAVAGGGFFDIDRKDSTIVFAPPPNVSELNTEHTNFYLYSYIKPFHNLTLTVGGSGDLFDTDGPLTKDQTQFNPKLGIIWEPIQGTTLRGAWFRVLKRTLITNQTVEPTQIAGFNQFFDEINATDYWVRGVAIDQKFTKTLYGGVQYTDKNLDVPIINVSVFPFQLKVVPWEEKQVRSYLFWTPHEYLSLGAEWIWERLDRSEFQNLSVRNVETNYFPLKINLFHPSGLSISLKETYVDQQGVFEVFSAPPGTYASGKDDFWLTDLAIRYRLPKRYGFIKLGATNLFDEKFNHFDPDLNNPRIQPARTLFISVTLNLT